MQQEKRKQILIACLAGICLMILSIYCRPVFYLNDDAAMRSILSGSYTGIPDGHAVYMKYPLTGVISIFYRVFKGIPWMELIFLGCIFGILVEINGIFKRKYFGLCVSLLFVFPFFVYMHYTVIAALLAGTAVLLACEDKKDVKVVAFWLLAWMIRSQVAYLSLPFLGVSLLMKLIRYPKEYKRGYLKDTVKVLCIGGAVFLLCSGLNHLCYANAGWKSFLHYNDARTNLYDYTNFLSTDIYEEKFEQYGMNAEEFAILNSYNTILDSTIDQAKMEYVAAAVSKGMLEEQDRAAWLKESVKRYYYCVRYPDNIYVVLWLAMVLFLAAVLLVLKKWWGVLLLAVLECGRSSIWIYLIWKDRFPERVQLALYLIELLLLLGMSKNFGEEFIKRMGECAAAKEKSKRCLSNVGMAILFCAVVGLLGFQIKKDWERAQEQKLVQKEWSTLKEYCEKQPETLYLVDVFSAVEYGALLFEREADNLMLAGGWLSASPLAEQRMHAFGAKDGAEALFENENVVFLAEDDADIKWLETYLQNRFGDCNLESRREIVCSSTKVFIEYRVVGKE